MEHCPEDRNYAHSEIWAYVGGQRLTNDKPLSKTQRKEYRTEIFKHARLVCTPLM